MGSSASSAVAAVLLVNELLNHPLEKRDLIPFALEGEKLASGDPVGDNIVASMLGGLVLIRDIRALDFHRIYTPPGLFVSVLLPEIVVSTIESRSALKPDVPLSAFIHQSANLGAFVIGMQTGDLDLISRSMKDLVIESQRKHYIPHFDLLQATAMEMGALGCSISGAGPAVFALCQEKGLANDVASNMKFIYDKHKLNAQSFVSAINNEGAILK